MHELRQRFYQAINSWSYQRLKKLVNSPENTERQKNRRTPANGFKVTEHALLRYFERVERFDIEQIKRRLTSENLAKRVEKLGDGKYPVGNFRVTVIGNTVITVDTNHIYKQITKPKKGD